MLAIIGKTTLRIMSAGVAAAVVATTPIPALAQDEVSEARVRKIEAEVRALQRAVFPGGDGRFFEPQIAPGAQPARTTTGPSTTVVTDILARLDALESRLQQLTARSEENANTLSNFETRLAALEAAQGIGPAVGNTPRSTDTNLNAMTGGASQPSSSVGSSPDATDVTAPAPDSTSTGSAPAVSVPAVSGPSPERLAAVQEITKPQTDDAADDEYSYGFRLWNAGFYPEARQQLSSFVDQHPDHWRTTYGRNLLGRAYLDDGQPEEAARWFLRNYQADRQAARAPDSLLFLAESMIALNDTNRACIALAEFGETYPALASGRLADRYENNRRKVTCN